MLVASATIGLIAPIGAQANDINIEGMNSYVSSKSSSKKQQFNSKTFANELAEVNHKIDGLESQFNDFEAGGFSDTTVMNGKAIFDVGGVENSSGNLSEGVGFQYTYQLNLNTSFTGDDDLYVRLKTGNATDVFSNKTYGTYLSSSNGNDDTIEVDKIWYSFPVGEKNTVWIGPKIENYYMHGATPSIYAPITKQFKLGGNGAAYGASTDTGIGWAYNADSGFSLSSNVVSKGGSKGFLTDEAKTNWSTQVGYTTDQYHVSLITALKYNGWTDSYYTTKLGKARPDGNSTNYGLRAYWRPDTESQAVPEISGGYDTSTVEGSDADTDAFFVGLTWKDTFQADDKIGLALGQPQTADTDTVEPFTWEAYYSFKINDSISMTPAIFGASDRTGTAGVDLTGVVVQTTFKF